MVLCGPCSVCGKQNAILIGASTFVVNREDLGVVNGPEMSPAGIYLHNTCVDCADKKIHVQPDTSALEVMVKEWRRTHRIGS